MKKVYLGGTAANSSWRDELIPLLKIDYFNPVVDNWDEEAMKRELHERAHSDYLLYVITPEMEGFYAVAEVVDDSNKEPGKTIYCFLDGNQQFSKHQLKSLKAIGRMIQKNGSLWLNSLQEIASHLNSSN